MQSGVQFFPAALHRRAGKGNFNAVLIGWLSYPDGATRLAAVVNQKCENGRTELDACVQLGERR